MKSRAARIVLLTAALVVVVVPAASLSAGCADDDAESCGFDCTLCLCCFHVRTVLTASGGGLGLGPAASVGAEAAAAPVDAFPRDILHVPKSAPSH